MTSSTRWLRNTVLNALRRYGKSEIFNSDQGSQFTSREFVKILKQHQEKISMDGCGRCLDNAKTERFWWALKYEDIKLKGCQSLRHLRYGVQSYVNFYNSRRIHSDLQRKTPDAVYSQDCKEQTTIYIKSEFLHLSFLVKLL